MADSLVSRYRVTLLLFLILVVFSGVLVRLVYLHVLVEPEVTQMLAQARVREQVIPARRGKIVDRQGNLLAFTRMLWEVGVDPVVARGASPEDLRKLGQLLSLDGETVEAAFSVEIRGGRERRWARLASRVDDDVYSQILNLGIQGVYGNPYYLRTYPAEQMAAHVVGFVDREQKGVTGVERTMDFYLRGQNGFREFERDGRRRELAQFAGRRVEPRDGMHVELTLDPFVQHLAEEALRRTVERHAPVGAVVIISEAATGEILAMASVPTFDPNAYGRFPVDFHRNRALTDIYEPGSTFKIVAAAAALEEGLVRPEDTLQTGMSVAEYRGRPVRLPGDTQTRDVMTMREVVVKSSNRGAAFLGMMLGERRLYDYCRRFGFGERTELGLPGEVPGILHPVERWDGLTITRLPMGHAVSSTPLQIHMAMSVIANDGILMEPLMVRRIFGDDGNTLAYFDPAPRRRVVSPATAELLGRMLHESVSTEGTARRAAIPGFTVAGKTGTTQKLLNGRYSSRHHIASFAGFFPVERPRIVMTVVVDEPTVEGTGYGGLVAAPIFREIGEELVRYLGLETPGRGDRSNLVARGGPRG